MPAATSWTLIANKPVSDLGGQSRNDEGNENEGIVEQILKKTKSPKRRKPCLKRKRIEQGWEPSCTHALALKGLIILWQLGKSPHKQNY
ncbi:hypothetical protein AVEN_114081-1 [Araneus ventricosus]|uniref:Uncharacterized protein n=1 Tax=Araneus ventricosus TaxID=182803 RepID=A0A4Y2K925_ARAVE|nr:hypothetical protein AVEN_114081-1 [Araneus ventricosus]